MTKYSYMGQHNITIKAKLCDIELNEMLEALRKRLRKSKKEKAFWIHNSRMVRINKTDYLIE